MASEMVRNGVRAVRDHGAIVLDKQARFCANSKSLNGSESGGGLFPAGFFVSSGPAISRDQLTGERERKIHESIH
jgi:hypothetical protein